MTKVWSSSFQETPFDVHQVRLLKDNFSYFITAGGRAIAVDVSDGEAFYEEIKRLDIELDALLITHHHSDHIRGASYLKEKTNCQVIGPQHETLQFLDQDVADGEEYAIGLFAFEVIATPGHSQDHVVYHFPDCFVLFSGDALFLSGCGRIFDSTPEAFFHSLQKLKQLPDKTLIFCGHDYLKRNLHFAQARDLNNEQLRDAPYVTFRTLEEEKTLNPFLQAQSIEEFTTLRDEKNLFDAKWG